MEGEGCALFGGGFLWISGFILIVVIGAVVTALMDENAESVDDEEGNPLSNMREHHVQDQVGHGTCPRWIRELVR